MYADVWDSIFHCVLPSLRLADDTFVDHYFLVVILLFLNFVFVYFITMLFIIPPLLLDCIPKVILSEDSSLDL